MGMYNSVNSILTTCCNNGWLHRQCLKQFALNCGYNLSCPLCCEPKFRDISIKLGIYVPDRDALHLDNDISPYFNCDAIKCECPHGRKYKDDQDFKIVMCDNCAGFGRHRKCTSLNLYDSNVAFECSQCTMILYPSSQDDSEIQSKPQITSQDILQEYHQSVSNLPILYQRQPSPSRDNNMSQRQHQYPASNHSQCSLSQPTRPKRKRMPILTTDTICLGEVDLTANEEEITPEDLFIEASLATVKMPKPFVKE